MFGDSCFGETCFGESREFKPLFDKVARHLAAATEAYLSGDPGWQEHVRVLYDSVAKLEKAVGRPPLPKGKTKAEQQAAYAEVYGIAATRERFGVKEETIIRNMRRAKSRRGQ